MKTVLFMDKVEEALWTSFLKYDFLLDEFRDEGRFALCEWNREGRSVAEALPEISLALGDETEWQAVVITDLRQSNEQLRCDRHFENPFDFEENYGVQPGDEFHESQRPLVRLAQMLGGMPEKCFINWPYEKDSFCELTGYEMSYAPGEKDFDLLERYRLGLPSPKRIICMTPRDIDAAFNEVRRRETQEQADEEESILDFWQRNDYPATARFVVFDRMAPAKSSERPDDGTANEGAAVLDEPAGMRSYWFDFWMCALALMVSTVEPSDLRAFTVYRVSARIDEGRLGSIFAARKAQWLGAMKAIDERCESDAAKLIPSEMVMGDMPETNETIPVHFDLVAQENLYSDPDEVALYKDEPESDRAVWWRQKARITAEFRELLRAPRRALRNAAAMFREQRLLSREDLEYCILNEYQKDRLEGDLQSQECDFARSVGKAPFKFESHEGIFEEHDAEVMEKISKRATKPQAILAIVVALVALLLGFVPYIFGLLGGVGASASALIVTLVCCAVFVVVWLLTLLSMRRGLRDSYVSFNQGMRRIVRELSAEAVRLEKKISSYASFRRRWAILDRQKHLELPTREMNWLGYKNALLKTRVRDIDEIAHNCDARLEMDSVPEYDWRELHALLSDDSFFNIRDSHVGRHYGQEKGLGSFKDLPYSFISGVALEPMKVE